MFCKHCGFRVYLKTLIDCLVLQEEAVEVTQDLNACMFHCKPNQVDPVFLARDHFAIILGRVLLNRTNRLHKLKAAHDLHFCEALLGLFNLALKQGPRFVNQGH